MISWTESGFSAQREGEKYYMTYFLHVSVQVTTEVASRVVSGDCVLKPLLG